MLPFLATLRAQGAEDDVTILDVGGDVVTSCSSLVFTNVIGTVRERTSRCFGET